MLGAGVIAVVAVVVIALTKPDRAQGAPPPKPIALAVPVAVPAIDARAGSAGSDYWASAADPDADKHRAEREAAADKLAAKRRVISEDLAMLIVSMKIDAKFHMTNTALVIDGDGCDGRGLVGFRKALRTLHVDIAESFDTMSCGELGVELDLHTKDGCKPGQNDQLILTDDGARRDKYAETVGSVVGDYGNGYMLGAHGCDATVFGITLMSGFDVTCDQPRITSIKHDLGSKLRAQGFKSIRCIPDGPEVPL